MRLKALKAAFPVTIPVLTGYIFIGIAFGVLLSNRGYGVLWAVLMSVFVFAGSMQFVAIGLLCAGFDIFSAAFITLMVNARHLFYGLSMLERFEGMGKKKFYMIFSLTDETFSLLCSAQPPEGVDKNNFYFYISLLDHLYWIIGSALGAVLGSFFTFNTKGIDFVMTALFAVIFIEQWEGAKTHVPAVVGIVVSVLCLILFGASHFIIPSMVGMLIILLALKGPMEGRI